MPLVSQDPLASVIQAGFVLGQHGRVDRETMTTSHQEIAYVPQILPEGNANLGFTVLKAHMNQSYVLEDIIVELRDSVQRLHSVILAGTVQVEPK